MKIWKFAQKATLSLFIISAIGYFYIILSMININKTDFLYISISVREYIKFNDLETASN